MTIGRNNEAPAAYSLTSTIKRLLDHLDEANLFSAKDMASIEHTLERLSNIVNNTKTKEPAPFLEALLASRIDRCRETLDALKLRLKEYHETIIPTHERLVSILRQMAAINTKPRVLQQSQFFTETYSDPFLRSSSLRISTSCVRSSRT